MVLFTLIPHSLNKKHLKSAIGPYGLQETKSSLSLNFHTGVDPSSRSCWFKHTKNTVINMLSELPYKVARYRVLALIGHTLLLVQVRIKISIDGAPNVC